MNRTNYFNQLTLRQQLEQLGKCTFLDNNEFTAGINVLEGKKVVIVGCGAQGLNQGLNMRDSGFIPPTTPPTTPPQPFLIQLLLFENNAATPSIVIAQIEPSNDTPGPFFINGSVVIEALEGDTVEVRVSHNHPDNRALTLEGSEANWISLEAVFLRDQPRMPIPAPAP
jgi:hypothetical protein